MTDLPLHDRKIIALRDILSRDHAVCPKTVVETGTWKGQLTIRLPELFEKVHTIEKSEELYHRRPEVRNVAFHLGDSREVLRRLLPSLTEPCLFYLDAHYFESYKPPVSKGVVGANDFPLWGELDIISPRTQPDIVVVDDVHCFGQDKGEHYGDWQNVSPESLAERLRRVYRQETIGDMHAMWRSV